MFPRNEERIRAIADNYGFTVGKPNMLTPTYVTPTGVPTGPKSEPAPEEVAAWWQKAVGTFPEAYAQRSTFQFPGSWVQSFACRAYKRMRGWHILANGSPAPQEQAEERWQTRYFLHDGHCGLSLLGFQPGEKDPGPTKWGYMLALGGGNALLDKDTNPYFDLTCAEMREHARLHFFLALGCYAGGEGGICRDIQQGLQVPVVMGFNGMTANPGAQLFADKFWEYALRDHLSVFDAASRAAQAMGDFWAQEFGFFVGNMRFYPDEAAATRTRLRSEDLTR